ncbi:hypothetical protein [Paenibacillus antibioticophila]|uniref:hypothetical protein n=1 Tax=Paenibacillus antibioticophila TaxID=1274374 RepID=UPI0005CA1F47|nr:hypothetical protein [Paenibacillus antibioticophila]
MAYQLTNGILTVDIAEPGEGYRETRFEWNGLITGITLLDGGHSFCTSENLTEGQGGGMGLCHEFGIKEAIGYQDTKPGEQFPKLGVGLLTRTDEGPYFFYKDYPVQPFKVEIEQKSPEEITFRTLPEECEGYAALLEKRISIDGQSLSIEYSLHNTGQKKLSTEEYCHNFLNINGCSIGPDYRLEFPVTLQPEVDEAETSEELMFDAGRVIWEKVPEHEFYFRTGGYDGTRKPYLWELFHLPSGAGVREVSRLEVSYAAVWGRSYVVSPEIFYRIEAEPGQCIKWTRTYEFFSENTK